MTVIELISEALLTCGIIGVADPPSDAQATTAFRALIGSVDTASADPLKQLTVANRTFTLQPLKQAYTIGPDSSLDINAPRPQAILRANMIDLTSSPNPPHIPMDVLEWDGYRSWSFRNSPTPLPTALWYDGGYQAIPAPADPPGAPEAPVEGFGTINILGVPMNFNQIEFWASAPLTQASSYFDDLVFPPGYYEFLLYGLCGRLYPRFGRAPDPVVIELYKEARLAVESANAMPAPVMTLDSGLPNVTGGYWDGRTNSYIRRR
ncbi:MAG TPA: hypothetical protein VGR63_02575 [Casimicrobiaceae bacterium]|jgi:hypothetical protein|nr:hypothetical protein [Casimicrobiaceae bacterium]